MYQNEIFVPIKGASNYEVSNLGRVKSLKRIVQHGNHTRTVKERILQPGFPGRVPYLQVVLRMDDGTRWSVLVHRLVALHHVTGYEPGMEVDHIDGNKTNNCADNLRWVTKSENAKSFWNNHGPIRKGQPKPIKVRVTPSTFWVGRQRSNRFTKHGARWGGSVSSLLWFYQAKIR